MWRRLWFGVLSLNVTWIVSGICCWNPIEIDDMPEEQLDSEKEETQPEDIDLYDGDYVSAENENRRKRTRAASKNTTLVGKASGKKDGEEVSVERKGKNRKTRTSKKSTKDAISDTCDDLQVSKETDAKRANAFLEDKQIESDTESERKTKTTRSGRRVQTRKSTRTTSQISKDTVTEGTKGSSAGETTPFLDR
jgi:hypothetical protein